MSGAAFVFEGRDGIWEQRSKLVPDDGDRKDFFGKSVALADDGAIALVGPGTPMPRADEERSRRTSSSGAEGTGVSRPNSPPATVMAAMSLAGRLPWRAPLPSSEPW